MFFVASYFHGWYSVMHPEQPDIATYTIAWCIALFAGGFVLASLTYMGDAPEKTEREKPTTPKPTDIS